MRVGSFDSIAALVAQGLGIGIMPLAVARAVAIQGDWAQRQFVLRHRPAEQLSRAAQSVLQVLACAPARAAATRAKQGPAA